MGLEGEEVVTKKESLHLPQVPKRKRWQINSMITGINLPASSGNGGGQRSYTPDVNRKKPKVLK